MIVLKNLYSFSTDKNNYLPVSSENYKYLTGSEYSNDLIFDSEDIKKEISHNSAIAIDNHQSFLYEIWMGEITKSSTTKHDIPYKMGIDENKRLVALEHIPGNRPLFFLSGKVKYRPLFLFNSDKYFQYNIGFIINRYVVSMKEISNVSSMLYQTPHSDNVIPVPIFRDGLREIVFFSKADIKPHEILSIKK